MKVKDLERTANIAWSPKSQYPIYLAAGTAAQQIDASFETSSALEIYSLNISEPGTDFKLISSCPSDNRFHKIIWTEVNGGTIVGGCDSGLINLYSASKLLQNKDAFLGKTQKHNGPVNALDCCPFQNHIVASGASDSEIFIWDLNNVSNPMTPGPKVQPLEDVSSISWNPQVANIFASVSSNKCFIWDLKKNEHVIKLTDNVSGIRWKMVAWHPDVATQLCLASEEDHCPVIQLWDLRFGTVPIKKLENHHRGVLSVAWCKDDSDLLISCAKDNRILCWNPNSAQENGEILSEIARTDQWSFDIQWCPKNPSLIACPNLDGHVSVYSLMGGKAQQTLTTTTNKIAESFPGMVDNSQEFVPPQSVTVVSNDLTKPPKWLRKPCGASFMFGGKLVSFGQDKQQANKKAETRRTIEITQVKTDPEFSQRSEVMEKTLKEMQFTEYCAYRINNTKDEHQKNLWQYLGAQFQANSKSEFLSLLGYKIEDINNKLNQFVGRNLQENNVQELTDGLTEMDPFDSISKAAKKKQATFKIKTGNDTDGLITQALLLNNVEAAVELCIKAKRFADALIIATTGGPDLLAKTQHKYLEQSEGYVTELITAMVSEDWDTIINNCDISSWREALAAILTHSTDDDVVKLCEQLGNRLENQNGPKFLQDAQLCYICSGSYARLAASLNEYANKSSHNLQEVVEVVTLLEKAMELQQKQTVSGDAVCDIFLQYSSLLAGEGDVSTAVRYVEKAGTSEKAVELRDRLYKSLGLVTSQKASVNNFSHIKRKSVPNTKDVLPGFAKVTGLPSRQRSTMSPAPYEQTPMLDPTLYNPNSRMTPINSIVPPTNFAPPPFTQPTPYGSGLYNPQVPLNPVPAFNPSPFNSATAYNPNAVAPSTYAPPSLTAPPVNNVQAPPPMAMPPQMSLDSKPGWNDPPILSKSHKAHPPKEQPISNEPITHPLFGVAPSQQPIPNNVPMMPNSVPMMPNNVPMMPNNIPSYPGLPQSIPNNSTIDYSFGGRYENNQSPLPQAPVAQEVIPPEPELPIPQEHIRLQNIFEELKARCGNATVNAQIKRKLEDVGKKLEVLYDLLRKNILPPDVLNYLHEMASVIEQNSFREGLQIHSVVVSGPHFAQIASFMPGLKSLLQLAGQLQQTGAIL